MAGWTPKRNVRHLELSLPVGVEVALTDANFTAVSGVPANASIKAIEVSCRDNFDIRFATISGSTDAVGPYRTIKKGTTYFLEDLELPLRGFEDPKRAWRFQNPSGTGTTVLEIIFSDG